MMFELNENLQVKKELLQGTVIFTIDNFYKNPDEVYDYLFNREVPLWKIHEKPSHNSIHFFDRRFEKMDNRLIPVLDFMSHLCGQKQSDDYIVTNMMRFLRHDFNDYKNCYWWPHFDLGYNGIVYFNKGDNECGTNLYSIEDEYHYVTNVQTLEHDQPWLPKEEFKILKTLEPEYNRLVLFDGDKFIHGMNIVNDRYFNEEYRMNQVFFFDKED